MKRKGGSALNVFACLREPKGNSNSHGARPVHLIITMLKWIRTSRLSIKNSLASRASISSCGKGASDEEVRGPGMRKMRPRIRKRAHMMRR